MTNPRLQRRRGGPEGPSQEGHGLTETIFPRQLKLHRISELMAGPLHAWRENVAHVHTCRALSRMATNCSLVRSSGPALSLARKSTRHCPHSRWCGGPMIERQSASIENEPCTRCLTCYRLTRSGNALYDWMELFRWKPSPVFEMGSSHASWTDTRGSKKQQGLLEGLHWPPTSGCQARRPISLFRPWRACQASHVQCQWSERVPGRVAHFGWQPSASRTETSRSRPPRHFKPLASPLRTHRESQHLLTLFWPWTMARRSRSQAHSGSVEVTWSNLWRSEPGPTKGIRFGHEYGTRLWSSHWVFADSVKDFQPFEYEYLQNLTERVSRVYTRDIMGCRYPIFIFARICVYLSLELNSRSCR